jgi:hypothetical protein
MEIKLPDIDAGAVKAVAYAAIALAGIYYISKFGKFQQAGANLLKPVSDGLGSLISKITNGPGVQGSFAFITLKDKDFQNGYLKAQSRYALEQMHPGNASLLAQVINPAGQIKQQYAPLLLGGGLAADETGVHQL